MSKSPTQLSLKWLRDRGYIAEVTENWRGGVRHDLFGFADIVAVRTKQPGYRSGVVLVQTTTTSHVNERLKKMAEIPAVFTCIEAGLDVYVHGWALRGPKGKRKVWTLKLHRLEVVAMRVPQAAEPQKRLLMTVVEEDDQEDRLRA